MADCMILPVAYSNVSRRVKLLHEIWFMSLPNTIHAGLGHLIPGRLDFIRPSSLCAIFLTNPACYVPHPSIYQMRCKKCERPYSASSMSCIRDMMFEDRHRTLSKSVNQVAFSLTVIWRTVDYQQLSNMWNTYQILSKIYSVYRDYPNSQTLLLMSWDQIITNILLCSLSAE